MEMQASLWRPVRKLDRKFEREPRAHCFLASLRRNVGCFKRHVEAALVVRSRLCRQPMNGHRSCVAFVAACTRVENECVSSFLVRIGSAADYFSCLQASLIEDELEKLLRWLVGC